MPTKFFIHKTFWNKNFLKNSRIPLRKFSAVWDIKISTENRDMPPLIHNFFSIPENVRKTEGFLYKAFRFGAVRQKVPTKPWCPRPSYAWKFSIKEFFWNNLKVFSNEMFRYSETKTSTENLDTPPPPPLIQTFSVPEISETLKDSPRRKFSALWDKNFSTENLETPPPPPLIQTFSMPEINETLKDSPLPNFSALWDKKISTENRKSWHNPLKHKYFRYLKLMKH